MTATQRKRARRLRRVCRIKSRGGRQRARIIDQHGGRGYGHLIVWAHRKTGLAIAMVAALVEQETGFRHVYGHDPVRNPVKSPPGGYRAVTRKNYRAYKRYRRMGLGMQGVGLTQLTYYTLQDEADRHGGCWQYRANILVGCQHLKALIGAHGEAAGCAAYNGSGPAAQAYSRSLRAKRDRWRRRLAPTH